jgi:hypothetical protein
MKKKSIFKKVKESTLHFFSLGKKITICSFVLLNTVFFNANAQKAEVTVTLKTVGITNYKYACTDCWELGKNEYTSSITAFPVTGPSSFSSGCLQCDQDGDCTYGQDVTLFTQTGKFDSIAFIWYNWENNVGDRCLYEHQYFDDDGCLGGGNGLYNFRTLSGPSDGIYHSSPTYTRYQTKRCILVDAEQVPYAQLSLKSTWKYSGAQNLIVPSCTSSSTAFAASIIPSWTAQLYAGVSYSFNTCSSASGENTYIRIYGSNGYTKVAENDNGCGQAASLTFTPATDGYYYIEVSHADRSLTESTGILEYKINENGNQTCASALSIGTGSVKYFNTYCSTQDAPAQICSQSADEHKDVWFKYTPSSTGSLVINSTSNYDTRISVYSGACSSLTYLRCNTVGTYLGGPNILTLNVCKGTTYYISVGGTYGGTGAGRLSLSLTPGNTLPSITCPPNINLWNSPGVCSRIYDYTAPTGSDNCSGAVTTQIAGLPSGSTFPIGLTTNTFKVTDSDGATAVCSFTVFVRDNEYPVITCPPSVTINKCTAVSYYFPDPTVSDNCGSENVTIEQLAGLPSGSTFPLGVTTNTFRAIDGRPNASLHNCSFSITVTENAPLSITCPNNMVVDANPSDCYHTRVSYPIPRADGSQECGLQLSLIEGKMTGSEFPFGITTVSWEVATTDGTYQTASCSFTVTVRDRRPPVITCPADISVSPLAGNCQATVNYTSPTKSDNCFGPTYPLLSQISGLTSGASFPIGTTTNIFKATDLSGNSATCSFSIHVADATPPSITCPDNIVNTLEPTECGDVIDFIAPVGTDNCSGAITVQTEGLPSGSYLSAGSATNTFVVTDAAGMSASCSFTISVSDLEPPAITCPDNISVDGTSSAIPCETIVFYTSPIGTDNCQGVITTRTTGLPSGSYFPEGETAVSFVATDAGGLNSSCSFTVTVGSCNQAPVAQCKNLTVSADALCQATISPENANDNSSDPDNDDLTFSISPQGPYSLGDHTITFTARDVAGLQDECTFVLSVVDQSPPETPILPAIELGECFGTPPVPTTSDHCAGTVTGTTTTVFPIENQGTTVIIWTFDDGNGNSIEVPQNVVVDDITPPQIPVLSDLRINVCESLPEIPTTIDNCKGLVVGHTSSIFPILDPGHYNVIWNFDDGNGNSIDVSQNVIVEIPFVPGKYFNLNTCTLTPCPPGTYCPGGTTEPIYCPAGKYQGLEGQAVCIPCLAGTFSSETGSTFCTSCPAGKFQDLEGQDHCLSCPTGTYSDVTGSTVCTSCPAGQYQGLEGQDHCLSCPAGSYSDVTGSVVCTSCPAGQYQGLEGQDHCLSCPAGSYSDVTGSVVCTSCPAGQYQGQVGQDHCESCPAGTYSDVTGSVVCTSCPAGQYQGQVGQDHCESCPAGTYSDVTGSIVCTSCPAGQYQGLEGQDHCLSCPAGTYSDVTGSIVCTNCPAGQYQGLEGQDHCLSCPAGSYSDVTGSVVCKSCPAGQYQGQVGQDHCESCPAGTYSDVTGSIVCTSCPAGQYQGLEGQDHCLSCPAGSYSDVTGSVVCKSCPAGQYQGQVGQDHCESCPAGTYSDVTGSIVCTSCPAGQYQGLEGQDHCETCGPGTYSNATGAVACTNCPPGKFSSSSGSTSCTECPAHTYNPNSGASECLNCPAGTYNPNTGAVICPDCILSISCASINPVNTDAGSCTASSVNLIEPVVSNSCQLISLVSNAPLNYPVGSTVVTWIATDVSGVTATCQQTVTVKKFGDASLLYAYTILSNDEVKMKENIVESGGVGVITANKKVSLEKNSKIIATNTFVKSGNIDVKSGSAVTTKINGNVPSSLKPPFIENVNPGNNDVKINDNSAPVTLNLSNYGKIEVGKNVVATLSGHANVYIKELKLKEGSQLKFNQATHVMIDKKLDGDNNIKINDNAISRVQFYVEEEVKINKSSIVKANIYTKKEIKIENSTSTSRTYMTGQFIANKVDAGEYVTWNWDASYCPEEIQSLSSKNSNSKSMIEDVDSNFSKTSTKGGELLVYPNPAQNILFVKMNLHPHSRNQIEILNSLGEKISEQNYVSNYEDEMITKFDMSIYPNGLYFIRATMDGNKIIKSFSIHK